VIYLVLSVLSSVMIGIIIRVNESRNLDRHGVMFVNYLTATGLSLATAGAGSFTSDIRALLPMGVATGVLFVAGFLVYMQAVRKLGLAVPVTVTRLSVVIPVLGSLLFYAEKLSAPQILGLVLAGLSISLFGRGRRGKMETAGGGWLLLAVLFLLIGSGELSLKVFRESFPLSVTPSFVLLVFGVSSVLTLALVVVKRTRIEGNVVFGGIALGIVNFLSAWFILKVLQGYPGAIAFPLNNIGVIGLATLAGRVFWNERLSRNAKIGMVTALAAVILLNM
jgi:drug/metabolite transporter (DMT)-like permease